MNGMLTVCGMVALLVAGSVALPTGAPASVCETATMEPTPHKDDPQYRATGFNNADLPNKIIGSKYSITSRLVQDSPRIFEVTLRGPAFMGFVLRANTGIGKFVVDEEDADVQTMPCSRPAVTHKHPDKKGSITVKYEEESSGNPAFQATVVPDGTLYVLDIKS